MTENEQKQVAMHMDFFDRTLYAIEKGFYLEAIFREYAAIEGRLEVILGLLGAPCNKFADDETRKSINISHRIHCLKHFFADNKMAYSSKLDDKFFKKLSKWVSERNGIVHGFYKNEMKYRERSSNNQKLAEDGLSMAKMLYNEAKRLRRYLNNQIANSPTEKACCEKSCVLYKNV